MSTFQRFALVILDGWGLGPDPQRSALAQANTPFINSLLRNYPNSQLTTFGQAVGLPEGQMGNSEVGHIHLGAGRVVYQELTRINKEIVEGQFFEQKQLKAAMQASKASKLHLVGLLSDGGVHAHIDHLKALSQMAKEEGLEKVFIHAITDGRDTAPDGGKQYIQELENSIAQHPSQIASVIGRYYAMDRDQRWERTQKAYALWTQGQGQGVSSAQEAIEKSYAAGQSDEFVEAYYMQDEEGQPLAQIEAGDVVIFYNFRTDRPRQICRALVEEAFPNEGMQPLDISLYTMTRYDESFQKTQVIYEKQDLSQTLGECLAQAGKSQIRIAETEKYPHVTFFFNGGREEPYPKERRIIIPSPKVATYDLQPEMSAYPLTNRIIEELKDQEPDFLCLNYANADMVGHTGVFEAAIKAAEAVDECLQKLVHQLIQQNYGMIILADHGNSDYMINDDGSPHTAHTTNPVPCIFVAKDVDNYQIKDGSLADIAPTILAAMNLPLPELMQGQNLLTND